MPFILTPAALRKFWLACLLLTLAACGGGGSDNNSNNTPAVAPTLAITSDAVGTATGPFTLHFAFSAAPSGFATDRILISGGFLNGATLAKIGDTDYSLRVTPSPNKLSVVEVNVPAAAFKDATGQTASARAYNFSQAYDTLLVLNEPSVTVTHDVAGVFATGPITFTFDFSVDVGASFTLSSLTVSEATITGFTKVTGTRYTLLVTPPPATTGLALVQIVEGGFTSLASGVSNQAKVQAGVLYKTP